MVCNPDEGLGHGQVQSETFCGAVLYEFHIVIDCDDITLNYIRVI